MLSAVPASSLLRIFSSNQLGTALACDVVPSPLEEHQQFVIEANQILPFYQFTQPSVAVSLFSGNPLDLCDSFSVQLLRGQGPHNATHGDQDSAPGDPPNARAGDPTGPSPAVRRPLRWLSTATQPTRPN